MQNGYIQVYTGNGKGKTTAALGLALRAVCAGKKVLMVQFMKGMEYSELNAPSILPGFELEQYGTATFVMGEPSEEDKGCAKNGLDRLKKAITSGNYDVVIADEFNTALSCGLFSTGEALSIIQSRTNGTELILTGRGASDEIIDAADLVTEMKEIKHYYSQGVIAREGIEM